MTTWLSVARWFRNMAIGSVMEMNVHCNVIMDMLQRMMELRWLQNVFAVSMVTVDGNCLVNVDDSIKLQTNVTNLIIPLANMIAPDTGMVINVHFNVPTNTFENNMGKLHKNILIKMVNHDLS